jgi:DNA-binding GntR family transcriptional regulator
MGLSTMPVREALVRLEESGLVTQEPHKGAVVSRLSLDDLIDYYNLRRIIEPPSCRSSSPRGPGPAPCSPAPTAHPAPSST